MNTNEDINEKEKLLKRIKLAEFFFKNNTVVHIKKFNSSGEIHGGLFLNGIIIGMDSESLMIEENKLGKQVVFFKEIYKILEFTKPSEAI